MNFILPTQDATIRGHRCRYGLVGEQGPKVLLIMGFGMTGRAWKPVFEPLSDRFQFCWYDARGLGDSSFGDGVRTLGDLADDADALLAHLGWDEAHVAGISMGGMIAQHLAVRHPQRLASLALLATHGGGPFWKWMPPSDGVKGFVRANLASKDNRIDALRALLFPPDLTPEELPEWEDVDAVKELLAPASKRARAAHLLAISRHSTLRQLGVLHNTPTLVIKPSKDILVPPRCSDQLMEAIPGAKLLELPRAGHGLLSQCSEEINAALAKHWEAAE